MHECALRGGRLHAAPGRRLLPLLVLPAQCSRSCPVLTPQSLGMSLGISWDTQESGSCSFRAGPF